MALGTLSALLLFVALPPYDLWVAGWVALVPLLLALPGTSPREAALIGAFTGTVSNYISFRWCLELMQKFSNLGPFAYLVMLAMAAYQSIPWAIWCYLLRAPGPAKPGPVRVLAAMLLSAASFVALEFFFPIVFPWYLANTQHTRPETNSVIELAGVSLLSLAMVVVNLSLSRLIAGNLSENRVTLWPAPLLGRSVAVFWVPLLGTLVLVVGWHFAAKARIESALASAPKLAIGLVQPNEWIGQGPSMDGLREYQKLTESLVQECRDQGKSLDLIMWPESAVRTAHPTIQRLPAGASEPLTVSWEPPGRYPLDTSFILPSGIPPAPTQAEEEALPWDDRLAVQRGHSVPILFGTTLENVDPGASAPIKGRPPLYNCGVLVDGAGQVLGVAKKVKLLIFGETIPGSAYFPQIYDLLSSSSCLLPGKEPSIIELGQARLGIMICYEDLLPWFHYQLAQKSPQILSNLTNDAWFGKTAEPICHMDLAALRAVEGRCYLIRSTPTGVSAVIDPYGRLVASIPSDKAGTLREEVSLLDITTGFERWGDTVAWGSLLYLLIFGGLWWTAGRREVRV